MTRMGADDADGSGMNCHFELSKRGFTHVIPSGAIHRGAMVCVVEESLSVGRRSLYSAILPASSAMRVELLRSG